MLPTPVFAIGIAVAFILLLILKFKLQPFLALLIGSLIAGLLTGMKPELVLQSITDGMGSTLGFVATVVGLGTLFGAILERSGGTQSLAKSLIHFFGIQSAPMALLLAGFIISIPVFFDVAFIILTPVLYALQRTTGKSLLWFGIPLLAGLAITHSFIPPTPGPVAVADILHADLGWVVTAGILAGIPSALIGGLIWGRIIGSRIQVPVPDAIEDLQESSADRFPHPFFIVGIISLPIFLIMLNTMSSSGMLPYGSSLFAFLGHPFIALILANLLAWYLLGIRQGFSKEELLKISTRSLAPAGTIILLTGAGGAFKEVLIDTGIGKVMADIMNDWQMPLLIFGFSIAAVVRILQGSATVAMITAAGVTSSAMPAGIHEFEKALLVICIASGATLLSHVNDSGFWLVSRYFGLTEKQTFASWTVMTCLLAFTGLISCLLLTCFV